MLMNAYYNGNFSSIHDVRIPLTDRAVFFGDGIYDAMIGRNGRIFMQEEHMKRFFSNARKMKIPIGHSENEFNEIFSTLMQSVQNECFFIYLQLTRFSKERCHAYPDSKRSNLLVTIKTIRLPNSNSLLRLTVSEDIRHGMCNVKTLNLLPAVLAAKAASRNGADETVFVRNGIVTECSHSNIHIIKDGRLITHPLDNTILPGISRSHLLSVCRRIGYPIEERCFTEQELLSADEVLVTSTSRLASRAESVIGHPYGISDSTDGASLCKTMLWDFESFTSI